MPKPKKPQRLERGDERLENVMEACEKLLVSVRLAVFISTLFLALGGFAGGFWITVSQQDLSDNPHTKCKSCTRMCEVMPKK